MNQLTIKRITALLVDLTIVGIFIIIVENLMPNLFRYTEVKISDWSFRIRPNLGYLLYLPYFLIFDVVSDGRSFGKQIFGLKIKAENGTYLTYQVKLSRTLLKLISITFLPITAIIYLLFQGYNLQDALTKSKVVREKE